jgi:hypothetical protein
MIVDARVAALEVDRTGISIASDVVAMLVPIFGRVDGKEQTTRDSVVDDALANASPKF